MTIDEFIAEIESKKPPAPQHQIDDFEAELGKKLPDEYRRFLIACNGGYVGGRLRFQGPTPEGKKADAGVNHIGGFRKQSHFSLNWARECYKHRIPKTLVWIMDDPFGNAICLGLTGRLRGKVYFWDHECEPDPGEWDGKVETAGNVELLANSFTDFVAGLRELEEEGGSERKALEAGLFPVNLEAQCRRVEKEFPEIRNWIRVLCLSVFDEKGVLAIHGDERSRMLVDLAFWLHQHLRSDHSLTNLEQVYAIVENWIRDDDQRLGLSGYAPGFIDDWWQDRSKKGMLEIGKGGARLTQTASAQLLAKLQTMTSDQA